MGACTWVLEECSALMSGRKVQMPSICIGLLGDLHPRCLGTCT